MRKCKYRRANFKCPNYLRSGFTLLQMILILTVVGVITVASIQINQVKTELDAKATVASMLSHYEFIQKEAILHQQQCIIRFRRNQIEFGDLGCEPATFTLPEGSYIPNGNTLYMLKSGSLDQLDTISIVTPGKTLQIRFQMGSGQYVYEEL